MDTMEKLITTYSPLIPTRHLQSFWGASGDFWQAQWDKFIDITGEYNNKGSILLLSPHCLHKFVV